MHKKHLFLTYDKEIKDGRMPIEYIHVGGEKVHMAKVSSSERRSASVLYSCAQGKHYL